MDTFLNEVRPGFRAAVADELRRKVRDAVESVGLQDTALAAYERLAADAGPGTEADRRSEIFESQNQRELTLYGLRCDLQAAGEPADP